MVVVTGARSAEILQRLTDGGIEVYQVAEAEIQIAERIRFHMMDSGVRVQLLPDLRVQFVARSQRSDFPSLSADELFDKVHTNMRAVVSSRGYDENRRSVQPITNPMDGNQVLDVWHEVTYQSRELSPDELVEEIRWALGLEKYVSR